MSWEIHKLVYQAKSPIHIGYHKLGFIQRTRYYITGRAMWGAMTANITRAFYSEQRATVKDYEEVGKKLHNDIIPSYFFPAIDTNNPLLPEFTPEGLKYGYYSAEEFERFFISSFGQTAIEAENLTAEEATLHETEYIAPVIEEEKRQRPVYFVGYVFMKTDSVKFNGAGEKKWEDIKEAIKEIFVGGERKYGFGRLSLDSSHSQDSVNDFFGYTVDKATASVKIPEKAPIPGHLSVEENVNLKGDIEPMVGREWGEGDKGNIGFGQKVSEAKICWMPGSILTREEILRLDKYGRVKINEN